MRRKSGRTGKSSPEKTELKTRRQSSRRRKRSSSRSSVESNDEKANINIHDVKENNPSEDNKSNSVSKNNEDLQVSPIKEINDKSSSDDKIIERRSSRHRSPLKKDVCEAVSQEQEEGTEEKEEKKNKGKSKGKNKSHIEQSSNIIEPEIEHENVQGTPQSPSNDNADNENVVQNVNDTPNKHGETQDDNVEETKIETTKEEVTKLETDNFQSAYAEENSSGDQNECQKTENQYKNCEEDISEISQHGDSISKRNSEIGDHSSSNQSSLKQSSKDERSLTPEIKDCEDSTSHTPESAKQISTSRRKSLDQSSHDRIEGGGNTTKKKITLRRSPPANKETDKPEERFVHKERRSITEDSVKETEDPEEKPRKKITLKRSNYDERASNEEKSEEKTPQELSRQSSRQSSSEESGEKKRRLSSLCEDKGQDGEERPKKNLKRIKLIRSLSRTTDAQEDHMERSRLLSSQRRHQWNRSEWLDKLTFYKIDVDSIKIVCPSVAFLGEDELHLEATPRERKKSESDPKRKISMDRSDDSDRPDYEKQTSEDSSGEQKIELNPNIIAMNRKISIVDDTASKLRPPPSPAKHPTSDVLFITNLVRPFTVKQLKELLERTGKIKEDGFWTDRIKSKCYVQYESVEEAEATRNALHGVHWPIGNGKQLNIDYATVEDLEKAKNPAPTPKPVIEIVPEKENREPAQIEEKHREEKKRKDGPVREWDLGKEETHRGHSRSRSRERVRKHSRRSYTPETYLHRKQRKVEEPVPQKLMDDLFLKTKATPSIYWQPLSPEEIATKQKQRLVRMEEHKRRIEETRVRLRENRRGSFRRR